jgi:hypothetical protein
VGATGRGGAGPGGRQALLGGVGPTAGARPGGAWPGQNRAGSGGQCTLLGGAGLTASTHGHAGRG